MHPQPMPHEYQPQTIHEANRIRLSILPTFPRAIVQGRTDVSSCAPLLANVPDHRLTAQERQRRLPGAYSDAFELTLNPTIVASFDLEEMSFIFALYDILSGPCSNRWKVDTAILDYNLVRLHQCLDKVFAMLKVEPVLIPFSSRDWSIALEFYLQIDVDMFYMKTCSFRGADVDYELLEHPDDDERSLFCRDPPKAKFGMLPCNRDTCLCCHPRDDLTHRQIQPAVQFSINHIHRFLNGYEAILNCPATCDTSKIVYALTCPCGQFDYVSTTNLPFAQCFAYHQQEGNRIIQESLMGTTAIDRLRSKSDTEKINDTMWLYQHSAQCGSAMQLFLDCHPEYACLIPMKWEEANGENSMRTYELLQLPSTINHAEMNLLLDALPKPSSGYTFSRRQFKEQYQLLLNIIHSTLELNPTVALYTMSMVAVLPEPCSTLLQRLIESLFVTHTECKLNQRGHLVVDRTNRSLDKPVCIQSEVYDRLRRRSDFNEE